MPFCKELEHRLSALIRPVYVLGIGLAGITLYQLEEAAKQNTNMTFCQVGNSETLQGFLSS